jgi:hypothetical protein
MYEPEYQIHGTFSVTFGYLRKQIQGWLFTISVEGDGLLPLRQLQCLQ